MNNLIAFFNTALLATSSAVLSGLLGYAISPWLQSRKTSQRFIRTLWLLPFVLPAFLFGMLLLPIQQSVATHSNTGMYWILVAHVLMNAGYVASLIVPNAPAKSIYEAAEVAGANHWQIRKSIELPHVLPALVPGLLLVTLYSATSFGLVRTLGFGFETLETQIAQAAARDLDLPAAGVLALLQTVLTFLMFLLTRFAVSSNDVEFGAEESGRLVGSFFGSIVAFAYSAALISLVWNVFAWMFKGPGIGANISNLAGHGARNLLNISVLQAAGNSLRNMLVSVSIAFLVSWVLASGRRLNFLALLPIGISPVVWGLGALIAVGYLPREISSSWLALPILQSLFLIPLLYQLLQPARLMFSRELLDSCKVEGASRWQIFRLIELPLSWPTIRIALSLAGLSSLGEFGAASFLAFGDQETLPVVLFRLVSRPGQENFALAMTAASLFILVSVYVLWMANRDIQTRRQVALGGF